MEQIEDESPKVEEKTNDIFIKIEEAHTFFLFLARGKSKMEKTMALLSDGNETNKINWELALKNHLYTTNFLVLRCSKLNPSAPAYGLKDKLKKVLTDAISELHKKHNVSVYVDTQKEISEGNAQMNNKLITKENIIFLESQPEISNSKRDRDEQN